MSSSACARWRSGGSLASECSPGWKAICLARQLYEIAMKGEDLDPSEEEARLHATAAEIQAARKRLKYHGRIVLDQWDASEESRMKTLRDQARTQHEEGTP